MSHVPRTRTAPLPRTRRPAPAREDARGAPPPVIQVLRTHPAPSPRTRRRGSWEALRPRPRHRARGGGEGLWWMVLLAQRLCVLPAMEGVRWAFPCGTWLPSRAEWLLAVRSIQPEEKERIGQFVFARDAKAALVPRVFRASGRGAAVGVVGRAVETPHASLGGHPGRLRGVPGLVSAAFVVASSAEKISPSPVAFEKRDPAKP